MTEDYRKDGNVNQKTAIKIINAYSGGEPYIEGVQYTAFGRTPEVKEFIQSLDLTKDGAGTMKLYVGPYGVGKSFVLSLYRALAIKKGYVVMSTSIDIQSRYFVGTKGIHDNQGLALYRSLIESTGVRYFLKNAFKHIIDNWYSKIRDDVNASGLNEIYDELDKEISKYDSIPGFSDVRLAIRYRFKELNDEVETSEIMNYFLANYSRVSDVKKIGIAEHYINEYNWFEILNVLSQMFVSAGYKGLIIMVDQIDHLTFLPKITRQQNYKKILSMWNDINQGRTEHLSLILFGADNIINERKGFQEELPLYERTKHSYVIKPLPQGELVGLLTRLQQIHNIVYGRKQPVFDENGIKKFIEELLRDSPISSNYVRPICNAWIVKLNEIERNNESPSGEMEVDIKTKESVHGQMSMNDDNIPNKLSDD